MSENNVKNIKKEEQEKDASEENNNKELSVEQKLKETEDKLRSLAERNQEDLKKKSKVF